MRFSMIKHKKSNWGWYLLGLVFTLAVVFVVVHEVPVPVEHVEQAVPFTAK